MLKAMKALRDALDAFDPNGTGQTACTPLGSLGLITDWSVLDG